MVVDMVVTCPLLETCVLRYAPTCAAAVAALARGLRRLSRLSGNGDLHVCRMSGSEDRCFALNIVNHLVFWRE